jgi:hypothetical protein
LPQGFGGNDTDHRSGGADSLMGNTGNRYVYGGEDNDTLDGGVPASFRARMELLPRVGVASLWSFLFATAAAGDVAASWAKHLFARNWTSLQSGAAALAFLCQPATVPLSLKIVNERTRERQTFDACQ